MNHKSHAISTIRSVEQLVLSMLPVIEEHRYSITLKADDSPVTQADVLVEEAIHAELKRHLPDLTFHGEETFASWDGNLSGWVAVLDPIDGTENFCSGLKEWGTSLSLWFDGTHQASMLLLPELNESLCTGDTFAPRKSRITGLSSSLSPALVTEITSGGERRIIGCAVYNLFNVVRGSYARFFNPVGAYSWDLIAGASLALEHGCRVLIDDEPYDGAYLEPARKYRVDISR